MISNSFYYILILCCFPLFIYSTPVSLNVDECKGGIYNYNLQKEYEYDYSTKTKLWIKDVSDDAESEIQLKATVLVQPIDSCRYQLRIRDAHVESAAISNNENLTDELEKNLVVFSVKSNGALSNNIEFDVSESVWVKNLKRGIVSAFQLRSENELKSDESEEFKSSVLYETDLFGKCRTTYKFKNDNNGNFEISKKKALHACSLLDDYRQNSAKGHADQYEAVAEYAKGQQFIENHGCVANVNNGVLNNVECNHESTMKFGSHRSNGLQAASELNLKLKNTNDASSISKFNSISSSIVHEYQEESNEYSNEDISEFVDNLCSSTNNGLLEYNHAENYRNLINTLRKKSKSELVKIFNDASKKCKFGGVTIINAIAAVNTDEGVEAVMDLLDNEEYKHVVRLGELSRFKNPSANLINKFKQYLSNKDSNFVYLKNAYLIYSTLIKTFCENNNCDNLYDDWVSVLVANLGSNCNDSKNKNLVIASLKSIGNIGYINDASVLERCALTKENSLETRVSAIQSLRRFNCDRFEDLDANYKILLDSNDDAEVRINAFKSLARCFNSKKFQNFVGKKYAEFLLKEEDHQVVSYIADYAKERGISVLVNPIILNPEIRDKLELRFKDCSWNNYRFRYSYQRDAAIEVDTSMIYTKKSYVPRSVHFNYTLHGYGLVFNDYDFEIRMEGLDELIKKVVVDKLTSQELAKKLVEKPQQLLEILKLVAAKLKYSSEKPYLSMSVRYFGAEIHFYQWESLEELGLLNGLGGDWQYWIDSLVNRDSKILVNWQFYNGQIKKPLLNGFEFSDRSDVNMAQLHTSKGNYKVDNSRSEFNFVSNDGFSFFLRRHFSVEINSENLVALRKEITGVLNHKLDYNGFKEGNVVEYRFNVDPREQFQYMLIEGKYFKLDQISNFVEVTNFKVPTREFNLCFGKETQQYFGADACYKVKRPEFRSFNEQMNSLDNPNNYFDPIEDVDDFNFDAEDDEDVSSDYKRPMFYLTGPFRFEVIIYNNDSINEYIFKSTASKINNDESWESSWETVSSNGQNKKRILMTYSNHKSVTSRTYKEGMVFEVRTVSDNDVKFYYNNQYEYRNNEYHNYDVKVEDRLLTGDILTLTFIRKDRADGQISPDYIFNGSYVSKIFYTNFNFHFDHICTGKSLKSDLYVRNNGFEYLTSHWRFEDQQLDNSKYDNNYKFFINGQSYKGPSYELSGPINYGTFNSHVDLKGNFKYDYFNIETEVDYKTSYSYDPLGENLLFTHLSLPKYNVLYSSKVAYEFNNDRDAMSIEYIAPSNKLPTRIFFDYNKKGDKWYKNGIENLNYDLSRWNGKFAEYLKKNLLKSDNLNNIVFTINERKSENNRIDIHFYFVLNENEVSSIDYFQFGNLNAILANPNEIPEQKLGWGFEFNTIENYSGALEAFFNFERSILKKLNNFSSQVKSTGLFAKIFKLKDMDVQSSIRNGRVNFKTVINRLDHYYKGVVMTANRVLVRVIDNEYSEFDINYVKTFSDNTQSKGTGIVKAKFTDINNFYLLFKVTNMFTIETSLSTNITDKNTFSQNGMLYSYYIDAPEPSESRITYDMTRSAGVYNMNCAGKSGKPGLLDDQLSLKFDINQKLVQNSDKKVTYYYENLKYIHQNPLIDIDYESTYTFDPVSKDFKATSKSTAKFPALIDYKQGESKYYKYDFVLNHDENKKTENIEYNFESNSKFLNFGLSFLKLNYLEERSESKLYDGAFNVDYKLLDTSSNNRNFKLNLNFDKCGDQCINMKFGAEQDFYSKCEKPVIIWNCDRKAGYPIKENILQVFSVKCGDQLLTDNKFLYKHEPIPVYGYLKNYWLVTSTSDFYEPKHFEFDILPWTKESGSFHYVMNWDKEINYDGGFDYVHEIDENKKLVSTTYKTVGNIAAKYKGSCEFSINQRGGLTNKFNCIIGVPSEPEPITFGYKLFTSRPFGLVDLNLQLLNGRVVQVDLNINGNERGEFNASSNIYWDYVRDHKKYIVLNVKSLYVQPNHYKFLIEGLDTVLVKLAKIEYDHKLTSKETLFDLVYSYELRNGRKNRYDVSSVSWSDSEQNYYTIDSRVQKPNYRFFYGQRFDKLSGRLNNLEIKVNDLIDFNVYNEYEDQSKFRIALSLNKNAANLPGYNVDVTSSHENGVFVVESIIKKGNLVLSKMISSHDPSNTRFNVKLETKYNNYELNLGLFNEASLVGNLKQDGNLIGVTSMKYLPVKKRENEIVFHLKWNSFFLKLQDNLFGGLALSSESDYVFLSDFEAVFDAIAAESALWRQETLRFYDIQMEYICSITKEYDQQRRDMLQQRNSNYRNQEALQVKKQQQYIKRYLSYYNSFADKLSDIHDKIKGSKLQFLSIVIPKLSKTLYNSDENRSNFDYNIQWNKRTFTSDNIYKLSNEYRNRIRSSVIHNQAYKSFIFIHDMGDTSLRAAFNKYRYRLTDYDDYKFVSSVYNRRNIIGFGGESEILHTKSRYLLAHDVAKNSFSIVLHNEDNQENLISVYVGSKQPITIGYEKASVNGKVVALPNQFKVNDESNVHIGRSHNGICVHVDNEIRVCCYSESKSCTIALSGWWYGKVNGLLGETNNLPQKLKQEDWSIDKVDFKKLQLKPVSDETVKLCYKLFGKHSWSILKNNYFTVRPNGWRKVCEISLSSNLEANYCPLIKAISKHAQLEYVKVDVPKQCYSCFNNNTNKSYKVDAVVSSTESNESNFVQGDDVVLLSLPCDSKKYAFNYEALVKAFNKDKNKSNNYYVIKIDKNRFSAYQAENGKFVNFDIKSSRASLERKSNEAISEETFKQAIYYAQLLFSRRIATSRYLIITSCGNCVPYCLFNEKKLSKELADRNIIVSSWGDYNINLGEYGDDDVPVGYNEDKVYYYSKDTYELTAESVGNYKIQHEGDLCHRLALKTHGSVFNFNEVRRGFLLNKIPGFLEKNRKKYSLEIDSCTVVRNSKYGDYNDFSFKRTVNEFFEDDDN